MSDWYYRKQGLLDESTEGPLSDAAFLQLAYDGKLKPETLVSHPKHTKGQWVPTAKIPAAKQRIEKGHADRKAQKASERQAAQEEKEHAAQQKATAVEQRKTVIAQQAAEAKANSPISQFLLDGQSEAVVEKIYNRVNEVLTSGEDIQYIAVQANPVQVAPDCIVLTNRRFILFRQKMLGQMSFDDYLWRDLHDAQVKEGVMFATLTMRAMDGKTISLDYLPKPQARSIYRVAQEREEAAIEERRARQMEETSAGASNIVVNAPAAAASPAAPAADDPMAKLGKLKQMLDAGLIEQDEYDSTKQRILSEM